MRKKIIHAPQIISIRVDSWTFVKKVVNNVFELHDRNQQSRVLIVLSQRRDPILSTPDKYGEASLLSDKRHRRRPSLQQTRIQVGISCYLVTFYVIFRLDRLTLPPQGTVLRGHRQYQV